MSKSKRDYTSPEADMYSMWNASKAFTYEKQIKYTVFFDTYYLVARYGTASILEDCPASLIPYKRKEGAERCIDALVLLLSNSIFMAQKSVFFSLKKRLDYLRSTALSKVFSTKHDSVTHKTTLSIDEQKLSLVLDEARDIYEQIILQLKRAGVFAWKEDKFELNKIYEDFVRKA